MEWISVKDRLPDDGHTRVLVNLVSNLPQGGKITMDTDRFVGGKWIRWNSSVTHWMPLPEPPKEEQP